jgi:enoyl-CoA hydratase
MSQVTVTREGGCAVLTFANPPEGTIDHVGSNELLAAVQAAGVDPAVRVVVITGGLPGVFIRHYSVSELAVAAERAGAPPPPSPPPPPTGGGYLELVDTVAALPKPVIAAINGLCMGGGFELSLACDLRVAGEDVAAIGLPETRVGIFPGGGGTQRLPRIVGEAKALEIILRGLTFGGAEAHALGLVNELSADPLARALELAAELATRTPEALAAAKTLTRAALDRPLGVGLAEERKAFAALLGTESARMALSGFVSGGASLEQT